MQNPIIDIQCGYAHSMLLDIDGRVWTCGCNNNGRLGHGDKENRVTLL